MFRKFIFLLTLCALSVFSTNMVLADDGLSFSWGKTLGGSGVDTGVTFVSPTGDVYLAGYFSTTVDFDPSSTVDNRTSAGGYDMFISKYDSSGNYYWTKTWGGNSGSAADSVRQMVWDSNNNLYILGDFGGVADLNPDGPVDSFTSAGSIDSFLTKYDSNGNYLWTKTWGGTSPERASMLNFDTSGNIYIVGEFQGTSDFDLSPSVAFNIASAGNYDAYLTKLDSNSNYLWTKTWGAAASDKAFAIQFDSSGNYYISGGFSNTVDFDTGGTTDNYFVVGGSYYDIFLVKYNSSDTYSWTKTWGTIGDDWCASAECLLLDSNNNIYISAYAGGNVTATTIDLDAGSGQDIRNLNGQGDVVIFKLNSSGDYVWGKTYGGTLLDLGWGINFDSHDFLYVSGWYNGTADFDPTSVVENYTSAGGTDIFINKYDLNGNYYFTKVLGGTSSDRPQKISLYGDNFYFGGFSTNSIDMNPDSGVNASIAYASVDALFIKFIIDVTPPTDLSLISPSEYSNLTRPTLVFKKATDSVSGISSYAVSLDSGKYRYWNVTGIPSTQDASKHNATWRDDSYVKVEFFNEDDSSTTNDEINVYFRDLDTSELTEGKHTWKLSAYDTQGNLSEDTRDFYIDKNSPTIENLKSTNTEKALTITGLAKDNYFGSTKSFNGNEDIFDKVSSGPNKISLIIRRYDNGYKDFLTKDYKLTLSKDVVNDRKESSFSISTAKPLTDGYYEITIKLYDLVDNLYTYPVFYINNNSAVPTVNENFDNVEVNENDEKTQLTPTEKIDKIEENIKSGSKFTIPALIIAAGFFIILFLYKRFK